MQRKEVKIDPNDWRGAFYTTSYQPVPGGGGMALQADYNPDKNKYKDKALLDVLFNQEFMSKTNIDPALAKEIWKKEVAKNSTAYVNNYGSGKNKAWTEEFDKQFLNMYKKHEASFSRQMSSTLAIASPKARESAVKTIAGKLINPKSVQVIPVGQQYAKTAEAAGLTQEDLIDPKTGKLLTDDVSIAQPGPGYAASGIQISTKKGRFIIVDENIDRSNYNKELAMALNPIFFEGQGTSPIPIRVGSTMVTDPNTGQPAQVDVNQFIERRIVPDGDGFAEILYRVPYTKNADGRPVPDYSQPSYPIKLQDLQANYRAGVAGMLGTGMTESQQTMYSIFNFLNQE